MPGVALLNFDMGNDMIILPPPENDLVFAEEIPIALDGDIFINGIEEGFVICGDPFLVINEIPIVTVGSDTTLDIPIPIGSEFLFSL